MTTLNPFISPLDPDDFEYATVYTRAVRITHDTSRLLTEPFKMRVHDGNTVGNVDLRINHFISTEAFTLHMEPSFHHGATDNTIKAKLDEYTNVPMYLTRSDMEDILERRSVTIMEQ
jgi:hypothetical protein